MMILSGQEMLKIEKEQDLESRTKSTLDRFKEFRQEKKQIEEQELNEKKDDDTNEKIVYETDQDYDKYEKERE